MKKYNRGTGPALLKKYYAFRSIKKIIYALTLTSVTKCAVWTDTREAEESVNTGATSLARIISAVVSVRNWK